MNLIFKYLFYFCFISFIVVVVNDETVERFGVPIMNLIFVAFLGLYLHSRYEKVKNNVD